MAEQVDNLLARIRELGAQNQSLLSNNESFGIQDQSSSDLYNNIVDQNPPSTSDSENSTHESQSLIDPFQDLLLENDRLRASNIETSACIADYGCL